MKKSIVLLIIAAIIACIPIPIKASGYYPETLGEALPRDDGLLLVSGIGLTEDAWDEVLLYIDEAEIYNLRTGFAIGANEIHEGDCIRVMYEPGRDEVSHALVIYVHAGEQDAADFMVVVSDNIWHTETGCVFVTIDGKYRITIEEDTLLLDNYGYEMSWDEIVPGMEMFVWAAFVTASFPGQVVPDKIVLLN